MEVFAGRFPTGSHSRCKRLSWGAWRLPATLFTAENIFFNIKDNDEQ